MGLFTAAAHADHCHGAKLDHQRIAEPTRLPKAQRPAGATTSAILSRERRAEAQSAASRFGASPEARR